MFAQDDPSFSVLNQSGRSVHEFYAGTSWQGLVVLTSRIGYAVPVDVTSESTRCMHCMHATCQCRKSGFVIEDHHGRAVIRFNFTEADYRGCVCTAVTLFVTEAYCSEPLAPCAVSR